MIDSTDQWEADSWYLLLAIWLAKRLLYRPELKEFNKLIN